MKARSAADQRRIGPAPWLRGRAAALAMLCCLGAPLAALAETPAATGRRTDAVTTEKLRQLLDIIADPAVRAAIEAQRDPTSDSAPVLHGTVSMAGSLGDDLTSLRNHLRALVAATPQLMGEFDTARTMLVAAVGHQELYTLGLFLAAFVALGFGGEWLFRRSTRWWQRWLLGLELKTRDERVYAVFARLGYGLGLLVSYGLGSVGAFLLFDWSTLLKQILLGYLLATLFARLAFVFGRFFLAPGGERFRVAPLGTHAAQFLFYRIGFGAVLAAFGLQTITLLGSFGFSPISRELSSYALGIVLIAIALEAMWRFPHASPPSRDDDAALVRETERLRHRRVAWKAALSAALALLGGLWVIQAYAVFWLVVFAIGLPTAIAITQRSIHHVLRPADASLTPDSDSHRVEIIFLERGIRSLLIIAGAILLGHLLGVDFVSLTMEDTLTTRLTRSILSVIIVVLVADLLWHAIGALIDRKLASNLNLGASPDDAGHGARLQTLLPIMKNLLLAVLIVLTAMMVLAALGIQIGPLIASAGVVGVAIGFGAQTLVKDIISGIFYLIDDAFRIGEYIQSGTYKGTVESFSLRSVKLRHQRGALYTVPFGILGAVQNQSRDWVVDKITFNVPYDTDLEKVRKIVKRIGETLADDPEFGPDIIKPIKMQGVAQFGDYAIQIQTKMMTKPGDVQFMARRRALILIKQAFDQGGIGFALPTVQVSHGESATAAAAQRGLALLKGGKIDEAV